MMVGTRLLLRVVKVTSTVADHSVRPPMKIRTQLGPVRCARDGGSRATMPGAPSVAVDVMAPLLVLGPKGRATTGRCRQCQRPTGLPAGWNPGPPATRA